MAKARILAVVIIGVLLLSALAPGIAAAAAPTVANLSPYNGATDIMLMPTLECTYTANPDAQGAAWWQISTNDNFTDLVWDTGIIPGPTVTLDVPRGYLEPSTVSENKTYYWRVKVQDAIGYWSAWSATWSFTTAVSFAPDQPENLSPANGSTEISPDQSLQACAFYDGDGDGHYASQWQVTSAAGAYSSPLFDTSINTSNKEQITLPVGLVDYEKTYYWRVRYQDDRGAWSAWSEETSFTVVKNLAPSTPRNMAPADQATGVSTKPILQASDFSDPDATAYIGLTDSHAASQWQIRIDTGTYDNPALDSGAVSATTAVVVTDEAELLADTTYYWRVRYKDSYGKEADAWSGWSAETSFVTKKLEAPVASFSADKTEAVAGVDLVTFTDNSTPVGEIATWTWDFGDDTTENWDGDSRPPNGEISHTYTAGGSYTVTLTVKNGAAPQGVVKSVAIVVHEKPEASFTLTPAAPKAGKTITFTDTSTAIDDIESWEWLFDDGDTETWTAANRPDNRQITHKFKKGGEHTVSLTVKAKGDLGESFYNKKINVTKAGGFQFELWMILVGVGVVVVIAGVVYLIRARKGK
jgi:PKD repeat protein